LPFYIDSLRQAEIQTSYGNCPWRMKSLVKKENGHFLTVLKALCWHTCLSSPSVHPCSLARKQEHQKLAKGWHLHKACAPPKCYLLWLLPERLCGLPWSDLEEGTLFFQRVDCVGPQGLELKWLCFLPSHLVFVVAGGGLRVGGPLVEGPNRHIFHRRTCPVSLAST
jgi:hypothetical protein